MKMNKMFLLLGLVFVFGLSSVFAAPTFTYNTPYEGQRFSGSSIAVSFNVQDTMYRNVTLRLYDSNNNLLQSKFNNSVINVTPFVFSFTGLQRGSYYINALMGNTSNGTFTSSNVDVDVSACSSGLLGVGYLPALIAVVAFIVLLMALGESASISSIVVLSVGAILMGTLLIPNLYTIC
jgi:hypothetical protein